MAAANVTAISSFIEGAPPGELKDVIKDIKALTPNDPSLLTKALPAFQKYNEGQLTSVKLPGGSQNLIISPNVGGGHVQVLISEFNKLDDGRYFDVASKRSWSFDHMTQTASDVQSYSSDSKHLDLIASLHKSLTRHATEHYPSSTLAILPPSSSSADDTITLLLSASKYSPSNFWNGRFRCTYHFSPTTSTLRGTVKVDVHYYEDGNVRLTTTKSVSERTVSGGAEAVVREIAKQERAYQEELNRGFGELGEQSFKGLRRQLPVTRQKVEWEKVGSYRAGREIGGVGGGRR
ncbi:MAG: F-actin-capping protein subunit alpha [Ramalina farinacea]|uniref:F-actin-capping protein subunit alpha n=1 Tax=Ramalina farinacea TaxID=258253 RepID=A0AA43QNN1_9LECA|nr:F-actin-capping protein subunit alpha [Ramalina farinacea]